MTTGTNGPSLRVVGASAGSGKTSRLTKEVADAVDPRSPSPIDVAGLVAVTYTRKAHAELAARIRRTLVGAGAFERARRLPLAHLGTVHAVCLRLLEEFALDVGLSPAVQVLPGDETARLREALEGALDPAFRERMEALAAGLEIGLDARTQRTDWVTPVAHVMTLARSNRIAAERLPEMGRRSTEGLLALLPPPARDGAALDDALAVALAQAIAAVAQIDDGQQNTATALQSMRELSAKRTARGLAWSDWVRLAKVAPGRSARDLVRPLTVAAAEVERHPRLHADLREFTGRVFEAARLGLHAYAEWKARRRLVDYVDMVDRALALAESPAVAEELRARFELLVVDEFQDTSPVQLALFVRLHALAGRSVWVGDRKQCIFEYAGADPSLMEAVMAWARDGGGRTEQLPFNYRSRPELVTACSDLFSAAFAQHGYAHEEVAVEPHRVAPPALAALPPFGLWWLEAGNNGEEAEAMAEGVRRLLADPAATPVVDRESGAPRDVRPGDVAILVATNVEAEAIAAALHRRGIRSALARSGLLETPEGTLADAALRVLADDRDARAAAVVDALTGFAGLAPERWLEARIAGESERRAARERGETLPSPSPSPVVERIEALRPLVATLSPSEALDRVIGALDLPALCVRWPDPSQRLANLDALRALARGYEERCAEQREAATLAGMLRRFDELAADGDDAQHLGAGPDAVTLCTFHKAKGLEWPVVVLGSLNRGERRSAFDVCPESDRPAFDAADPLGGRFIRYWPWPFGLQKNVPLADSARNSEVGQRVAEREERERVRLLYVGFTRARDHLVLAARPGHGKPATAWLDELRAADGRVLLALPAGDEGEAPIAFRRRDGSATSAPARVWRVTLGADPPERLGGEETPRWFARPVERAPRPGYWIRPSHAAQEWPGLPRFEPAAIVRLGRRQPLGATKSVDWDTVGTAVHAFLAADVPGLDPGERLERARRLLAAPSLLAVLSPAALLDAGDALRRFVDERWPGARWRREVPVTAVVATPAGARRVAGAIDLLLEVGDGFVVIDHKSFPGSGEAAWRNKASELSPQVAAYAEAIARIEGKRLLGCWLHFLLGGAMVELVPAG